MRITFVDVYFSYISFPGIMLIFEAGRHIKCKNDNLVEAIPHIYLSFQQYSCPITPPSHATTEQLTPLTSLDI